MLIVGIPMVVLLLSTALYYLVDSKSVTLGTVNNGQLIIPPVRFSEAKLSTLDGQLYDYTQPAPKWTFVVFGGQNCSGECEKMLYISRQSNIALAKKMNRVRRAYVSYEQGISQQLKQHLDQHYEDVQVLSMSRESVQQLFSGTGVDPFVANRFFVVDEHGWLMMYYAVDSVDDQTLKSLGKDVLGDMKRLLK